MMARENMKVKVDVDLRSFLQLPNGKQRQVNVDSPVSVYFGFNQEGAMRLSFLSAIEPLKVESTANLMVSYNNDKVFGFWSHFDLIESKQETVFLSFAQNLIEATLFCTTVEQALIAIKQRFITWKTLFKKIPTTTIPYNTIQGVYGELLFLYRYMIPHYGVNRAIMAWSGPDSKSKDFAIDDTWFEVKTIGANTSKIHISSISQLSSEKSGKLIVIKVEAMSDEYENDCACIAKLFDRIKEEIKEEAVEDVFYSKLSATGVMQSDEAINYCFSPKEEYRYVVDEIFPKITEKNKPFSEICDVEYDLSLNALEKYLEHQNDIAGRIS